MTPEQRVELRRLAAEATRKPIPGYVGYEADTNGHIWSVTSNWRGYGARQLTEDVDPDGYLEVRVYRDGKRIRKDVHTLVSLAFNGLPALGQEVRHIDGDKQNNLPDNLLWGTRKQNADDRERHGRTARGSRNGCAKLTELQVVHIKQSLVAGARQCDLAAIYGINECAIGHIGRGEAWAHVTI